jgi:flavin reductase (DIM6/NTAB) family NADH-FMN oxidoreductase RutF
MSMKEKQGPRTILFPMPSVLIGAEVDGKANFMTVAWCGISSHQPPSVSVAIRKGRHTLKGIHEHLCFSVNIPTSKMAKIVDYCGIYSGKDRDKSELFTITRGENPKIPLIDECPVNLECTLMHTLDLGSHTLIIGEIIQSYVRKDCLQGKKVDPLLVDPLIYSTSSETYHKLGEVVGHAFKTGKE